MGDLGKIGNCFHRIWKVVESTINRPIWSHCSSLSTKELHRAKVLYGSREHWTTGNMQLTVVNKTSLRLGTIEMWSNSMQYCQEFKSKNFIFKYLYMKLIRRFTKIANQLTKLYHITGAGSRSLFDCLTGTSRTTI